MNTYKKNVNFDLNINNNIVRFLNLIKGSYSLDLDGKRNVLDAIPTLNQSQVDMLFEEFRKEIITYEKHSKAHPKDVKKLAASRSSDWQQLSEEYNLINNLTLK